MKAELTNEKIVQATEEVNQYLEARKVDSKEVCRIRISIEEVLMSYQQAYGTEAVFHMDMGRGFGKERIRLRVPGKELDPFQENADADDSDEMIFLRQYLKQMGQLPRRRYRRGVNEILYFTEKKKLPDWGRLLIAVFSAVVLGLIARALPAQISSFLQEGLIAPLLNTLMGFLNAVAGPLIFFSVVTGIRNVGDAATFSRIGKRICLFFGIFIVLMTVPVAAAFLPMYSLNYGEAQVGSGFTMLFEMILDIVPANLLTPFIEGNTLQILFLAFVTGVAMIVVDKDLRIVSDLTDQSGFITNSIMGVISGLIPFFVFGSLFNLMISGGFDLILTGGKLFLSVVIACLLIIVFHTVVVWVRAGISPVELWKMVLPTFIIALTTASSGAAFKENMTTCVNKLGINKKIVDFGLPFGQVIYMPGAAILNWFSALSVAESFQMDVSVPWLVIAVIASILISIAAPPVPGGLAVAYTVLFSQLGLPLEALAVLLPMASVLDFLLTATNVFSGQCILAMASKGFGPAEENQTEGSAA